MGTDVSSATAVLSENGLAAGARARTLSRLRVHPLIGVLLVAAVLRFWQLGSMPILYFDSGAYLGEGRFLSSVAQRATDAALHPLAGEPSNVFARVVQRVEDGTEGHSPDLAKPGQAILLALAMLLLGPSTLAAGSVPALAGVGTVAATYVIGSVGWSRRVGAVAALLLAVSAEHLVYSREPLVESTGLLFATLASLLYLRGILQPSHGSLRTLFAVGVLFGISFTCNNRLAYLPLSFGMVELALWRGPKNASVRLATLALGFVAPLAVVEVAFLAAQGMGRVYGATPGFLDYAHQFANFVRMNPPSRRRFDQWPTFFADLGLMDGLPMLGLLLIGIVALIARRRWTSVELVLVAFFGVPLVLFSVYSSGEVRMRNFSVALPWAMLVASIGLWGLADQLRYSRIVAAVGLLAVGAVVLPHDVQIVTAPNAIPDLLGALRANGIQRVASTNGPVLSYYIGEEDTNARLRAAFINDEDDLREIAADYPYIVVDMQAYWTPGPPTEHAAGATPVFQGPNGSDMQFLAFLLERHGIAWGDWNSVLDEWARNRGQATLMRMFSSAQLTNG
jgi:Dolichyl-phosphate-mannose-protein mannosyltransferase